jgi:23S rRNA (cytidine1920-2'-O)/16S rRNA (cytidine1409-2'-O)-methyltransferase
MKRQLIEHVIERFSITVQEAQGLIMAGKVLVNDKPVTKKGLMFPDEIGIRIKRKDRYVSRGSYKLLTALNTFDIDINGLCCIDVGSSTGGFTQVLLEAGAQSVYAVDCGTNQLDFSIRNDKRVTVFEDTRIQDLDVTLLDPVPVLAVIDVSFTTLLGPLRFCSDTIGIENYITLVKPQFEYKRLSKKLKLPTGFNGVVSSQSVRDTIVNEVISEIHSLGLAVLGKTPSSIEGSMGNQEYLLHIGSGGKL